MTVRMMESYQTKILNELLSRHMAVSNSQIKVVPFAVCVFLLLPAAARITPITRVVVDNKCDAGKLISHSK